MLVICCCSGELAEQLKSDGRNDNVIKLSKSFFMAKQIFWLEMSPMAIFHSAE